MSEPRTIIPRHWLPERLAAPGALALSAGALSALGVVLLGLATLGFAGMVGLADYAGVWLLALPLLVLFGYLAWRHEKVWIHTAILGHVVIFLNQTNEGVGGGEIAFGALVLFGLVVWLFKEVVVHRRFIVRTGFDALLVGMFVVTSVVALIACILNNGDLVRYGKEFSSMFDLLLFFPVRSILRTRRDVYVVLALLAILGIVMGFVGIATYRQRLVSAVFAYQIESSRVFANEPVAMIYAIFGVVVVAYAKRTWAFVLGVVLTTSGLLFLMITFSRGSIVSTAGGIVLVILFSGHARRIVSVLVVSLVVGSGLVYLTYPNIAETMATSVGRRLSTVGATTSDVSFNLRVIEASTLLRHYVPYSPLIGHGYGVRYRWYDPTEHHTTNGTFVHNGYVRLLFKYGYPLAALFLLFLAYPLLRILMHWPSRRDQVQHAMIIGVGAYLVTALVNNYVSDMFSHYSGPLNYVLCWAILDFAIREQRAPMTLPSEPASPAPLAVAGA